MGWWPFAAASCSKFSQRHVKRSRPSPAPTAGSSQSEEARIRAAYAKRQKDDARLKAALAQLSATSGDRSGTSTTSRINLVFPGGVPAHALDPDYVRSALKSWIDFSANERPSPPQRSVVLEDTSAPAGLHKGMTESELLRLFGDPAKREAGTEGDLRVEVLTFKRDGSTVEATMVEGVLVRFRQWSD